MKSISFKSACCAITLLLVLGSVAARSKKLPVGSQPEKLSFKDIHYLPRSLEDFGQAKAYVLAFTTTGCPLVQRYLPRLNELASEYSKQGVQFIAVNEGPDDSIKDVAYQAMEYRCDFPFVKDFDGQCAKTLGVDRTPQVVVLDGEQKLRYRGRIDSQYRLSGVRPSPERADLKLAIDDLLAGHKVRVKETPVDGCAISFPAPRPANTSLTYARDIAPLINEHCVVCHHKGTEAPFSLTTYEKVASKANAIAEVVDEQRMPPWFAHPGFGKWLNERSLSRAERQTIIDWARGSKAAADFINAYSRRMNKG